MRNFRFGTIQDLLILREELNKIFIEMEKGLSTQEEKKWEQAFIYEPIMDAMEYEDKFVFLIELPGISLNDVELHLDGSSLIISGTNPYPLEEEEGAFFRSECNYGHFRRIIRLKTPFDSDTIDASLKDGILKIIVNKKI